MRMIRKQGKCKSQPCRRLVKYYNNVKRSEADTNDVSWIILVIGLIIITILCIAMFHIAY